ncbi:MAG: hypothetical protein CMP10_18780 [Zetaproteobacteria bacterium]|nr:hypothetical protein [Pseudobdellovibrionaceae bacterium]
MISTQQKNLILNTCSPLLLSYLLFCEYQAINHRLEDSWLHHWKLEFPKIFAAKITTAPGSAFGITMAIAGCVCFFIVVLYSIRKRIPYLKDMGELTSWLDIHIFFGSMGPIFIIFHSNFAQGGIAGLAFWTMIIVTFAGFIGHFIHRPEVVQRKKSQQGKTNHIIKWIRQKKIFRYWNAIHLPFAVVFLISAFLHITSSLFFW